MRYFNRCWGNTSGLEIKEIQDDGLEVTISRGALVTPISQVYLYTEVEQIYFTVPGE